MTSDNTPNIETEIDKVRDIITMLVSPIGAMLNASGLTLNQAKTCVYYAVATWLYELFDFIPILEFRGNSGTGKTEAINQLEKLLAYPQRIKGKTYSVIGKNLDNVCTAIIEEGDFKQERTEELIRDRCTKNLANQIIHIPPQQKALAIHNVGATVIHKRQPFSDAATRNRAITIRTRRIQGKYRQTEIANESIKKVAELVKEQMPKVVTSNRVSDAWRPLTIIATCCGDKDWLEYSRGEMAKASKSLSMGDQYEPEDELIKAIIASSKPGFKHNIKLVQINHTFKDNFDLKWSTQKIHAMSIDLGFEVKYYSGYDWLVANPQLLEKLAKERNIDMSPPDANELLKELL